jgi:CheY-like chemotaxis protein
VLLVEDNDFNRQVGVYLLERQGYRVAVACSGPEALDRLEREEFDLVLMDLGMPGMDGLETTVAIRRREAERAGPNGKQRRLPIVALTAHVTPADQERCLQAGMDGHVSKPLNPDQLRDVLGQVLGSRRRIAREQGPASSLASVFDRDRTLQRLSGNSKLFAEVVKLFQENSEQLLAQMRQALRSGNGTTLKETAHTLKGSMSFFNAPAAVAAAVNVEKQAENAEQRSQALADLEREVEALRSALAEAVRELSPS